MTSVNIKELLRVFRRQCQQVPVVEASAVEDVLDGIDAEDRSQKLARRTTRAATVFYRGRPKDHGTAPHHLKRGNWGFVAIDPSHGPRRDWSRGR